MPAFTDKLTETTPVTSIEDNMDESLLGMGRGPQVLLHQDEELACLLTGVPFAPFNQVFRARIPRPHVDSRVTEMTELFSSRGLRALWPVGPSSQPDDLCVHLERKGWTHGGDSIGMWLDLAKIQEPMPTGQDLDIRVVDDVRDMERWAEVAFPPNLVGACSELLTSLGFAFPWRHYLCLEGGRAVACSQLFFGAGVAGIYLVRTVPDARRQGIGTALTLRTLLDASDMGCRFAVLTSSPMGEAVYRRLGFSDSCRIAIYESPLSGGNDGQAVLTTMCQGCRSQAGA